MQVDNFVEYYNHHYHESLGKVTSTNACFGHDKLILKHRQMIKRKILQNCRLRYHAQAV